MCASFNTCWSQIDYSPELTITQQALNNSETLLVNEDVWSPEVLSDMTDTFKTLLGTLNLQSLVVATMPGLGEYR